MCHPDPERSEREGSPALLRWGFLAVFAARNDTVALKELIPLVELERARMLFLINDVRARSRGDHHRSRRQLDVLARIPELAVDHALLVEDERSHVAELVGNRFNGREEVRVGDA